MSDMDPEFLKQLQEAFVTEAREQLQNIMNKLIVLESEADEETKLALSEDILHELHSMKGNSRAAGVSSVETICQYMESAIFSLRRKKELLYAEAADVFHAAIDILDQTISSVDGGNSEYVSTDFAGLIQDLKFLDERARRSVNAAAGPYLPGSLSNAANQSTDRNPESKSDLPMAGIPKDGTELRASAGAITGEGSATISADSGASTGAGSATISGAGSDAISAPDSIKESGASSDAILETDSQGNENEQLSDSFDDSTIYDKKTDWHIPQLTPTGVVPSSLATAEKTPTAAAKAKITGPEKGASTRIALWKLDKLLRESEEMLILKQISEQHLEDSRTLRNEAKHLNTQIQNLARTIRERAPGERDSNPHSGSDMFSSAQDLQKLCDSLEARINSQLRRQQQEQRLCFNLVDGFIDSVKSLLMQDFSGLLSVVPKVVRDLSRELKKDVDLEVFGTEIEIDRRILEEIKDPVIHLVRNSLDHGLETAEQRIKSGKPARSAVRIGASRGESGNIELLISDDGRGINSQRLKEAALREGAISKEEFDSMSNEDAIELMYRSSVSTSESVTEISGRGLGMAIVRDRIHDLGGRVLVETELGKGTTFRLQLPTKMSTFRGIQLLAGGQSFIIPTLNVNYAGRIVKSEIRQQGSRNTIYVNDHLVSVQNLADVLDIEYKIGFKSKATRNYQQIVIVESGGRNAGFLVDEILHEHEVLVRGLSLPLVRVPNIAGATILGSGQVVPVLNTADLLESSIKATEADRKLHEQLLNQQNRQDKLSEMPVFLVDKHSTSQVMLKTLLESEGYLVQTFSTNESALEGLDCDLPLILLKSSELPETQESGLAYWIRRDLRLKNLPIVFFGSYPVEVGKKLSAEVGGTSYFSKVDFDRSQLLELIETLTTESQLSYES